MAELGELGGVDAKMKKQGGKLMAISVDPPEVSRRLVEKRKLPFPILCDTERTVIQSYGLVHAHGAMRGGDIAIPAQILVGRDGKILNRHISSRVTDRLDPDDVIEMLRTL